MTAFVGRTQELQALQERLDRALEGQGGVVFLTGDAGAGKSTLVERFLVDAALQVPNARVIAADCSEQYGAGEPYQPFVEAFRDLVTEGGPGGQKARLRDLARELAPHWLAAIPVAGDIIAATAATAVELKEAMGGGTATVAAPSEEALFFQYTELLLAAAAETPVVLFIDDLHWADRASVSLLGHIGRKIVDQPVLILGTYRAADVEVSKHPIREARLELERYGVAEELVLSSLGTDALAELIEEELGAPPTPELQKWLEKRAGSNPLFFVELLKWLVENEFAQEVRGEWSLVRRPEDLEIPRSAESAIEKRLNRLDPDIYRIVEYASVEGNEFNSVVLSRLLEMDELELEEQLEPLARVHRLIRMEETRDLPNGDIASVYEFSHSLFQDVLHKNLQGKRRILLHRKTAGILEEIYAADIEAVANKLAIHYDEGRQPVPAYDYALRAAERASRFYAHWDALELLQRGLKNSQTDVQRLEVLERLADENRFIGRYTEALDELGQALDLARSLGNGERELRLKRKVVVVERDFGNRSPEELVTELERLVEQARELEVPGELCEILWRFGDLPGTSPERAREALEIAEGLEDPALRARAHYRVATVLVFGEDPNEAIPHAREALEFYRAQEDTDRVGLCQNCLAIAHLLIGDHDAAVEAFQAAAESFDEVGDPVNEASVRNNLGILLTQRGDWEGADANLAEAVRLARRMDATARLLHPLENLGDLREATGEFEAAREVWQELLDLARETGYWESEVVALCGLTRCDLRGDELSQAEEHLARAAELLSDQDTWTETTGVYQLTAARVAAARGDREKARDILSEAEQAFEPRDRYRWAEARVLRAEQLAEEDPEEAIGILEQTRSDLEKLGTGPMTERVDEILARIGGATS